MKKIILLVTTVPSLNKTLPGLWYVMTVLEKQLGLQSVAFTDFKTAKRGFRHFALPLIWSDISEIYDLLGFIS